MDIDAQKIEELIWFAHSYFLWAQNIAQRIGIRKINPRERITCRRAEILIICVQIKIRSHKNGQAKPLYAGLNLILVVQPHLFRRYYY